MTKQDAIKHFDSASDLAKVLGISPSAVSQWPDELSLQKQDQIRGAALRVGKKIDEPTLKDVPHEC